jgi:hypothetical protein
MRNFTKENNLLSVTMKRKLEGKEINLPNEETLKTFEKTNKGIELVRCSSIEDFFKKLGIE